MIKRFLVMIVFMLTATFCYANTHLPGGLVVGTIADEATADVTPGEKDVFIDGTLEIDGNTRLDGGADITGEMTVSSTFTNTGNVYGLTSSTRTIYKTIISTIMADTKDFAIAESSNTQGWGSAWVIGHSAQAEFTFTQAGVVTLSSATYSTTEVYTTNGTDGVLNIYDDGVSIADENQLAGTYPVIIELNYFTP